MISQQEDVNKCAAKSALSKAESRTESRAQSQSESRGAAHSGKNPARYTITTALPYANGPVHIGHLAGVYVPADIYARYLRLNGKDVVLIGGSDEHGVPITLQAKAKNLTPQQVVDHYHAIIKKSFEDLGISFDIYSRTSTPLHAKTASDFFKTLYEKGCFEEKTSLQYYDEENHQFLADRYITGTCPHCGNEKAYGDQCEKCGTTLSPDELIHPKSAISGNSPVKKETKHWYLPLGQYEDFLRRWILEGHKDDWKVNVYGQCKSWIDQGLLPRAVTRDLDWGVKLPLPESEAAGKVLYVWFDAPIGYISATKELLPDTWEKYWKGDDTKLVHFIGKDNIVFHCIIFPVMLKAEGSYILPENVPANEFLNLEGDKISTSRNWAVWLHEYLEELPGKQDVLRYVLTANGPETKDNDFTWKDYQARNNNELLAVFGNLVNRTLVLIQKYFDGVTPAAGELSELDRETLAEMCTYGQKIGESIELYRFREALGEMMNLARLGNKYLTETEPWKLWKTDPKRVETVLYVSLQIVAHLAVVCEPFLPFTALRLRKMLSMPSMGWKEAEKEVLVESGKKLGEVELLFEKIEDEVVEAQMKKLEASKAAREAAASGASGGASGAANGGSASSGAVKESKPLVSFDDFAKMDLRVGVIKTAEKVEKTKKLLKLTVDTGLDTRTIVSGIAEHYAPEELPGKKVCVLVNLAPKDLKGIPSQGMLLLSENPDGRLLFVEPGADAAPGAEIR